MTFRDARLDGRLVSMRAVGGSVWDTDVGINDGGYEFRNANRSVRVGRWTIAYDARMQAKWEMACNFFDCVGQGKLNTWRLLDPFEYKTTSTIIGVLVAIDATHWQTHIRRSFGSFTRDKKIVLLGDITVQGTGVYTSVDTTGVVTKVSGAAPTGWTSREFHKHARFDTDENPSTILDRSGSSFIIGWPSIPIVEVLEAPS